MSLLDDVLANPDDLATRSVYADSIAATDPIRAEAIQIGCALEAAGAPTIEALVRSDLTGDRLYAAAKQHRRAAEIGTGFVFEHRVADGRELPEMLRREPVRAIVLDSNEPLPTLPPHRVRSLTFGYFVREPQIVHALEAFPEVDAVMASVFVGDCIAALPATVRSFVGVIDQISLRGLPPSLTSVGVSLNEAGEFTAGGVAILDGRFPAATSIAIRNLGSFDPAFEALVARAVPASLRHLELWGGVYTPEGIRALLGNLALDSLTLRGRGDTDETVVGAIVEARSPIRRLDLGTSNLGPRMLGRLLAAHPIESLTVAPTRSTAALLAHLARDPNAAKLRELDLSSGYVEDDVAVAFGSPNLAGLRLLSLSNTQLGDVGLAAIVEANLPQLVVLDLVGCGARISPALRTKRSLARIGTTSHRPNHLTVVHAHRTRPDALIAALRAAGYVVHGNHQSFKIGIGGGDYVFPRISQTPISQARDIAYLIADAGRREVVARYRWSVTIVVTEYLRETRLPELVALIRAIARAVDGVAWDARDDQLLA